MFIYSMFIEALILKAPDVKALYIWKTHWKALFLQVLSFRFIKQRTFSLIEIEKIAGVQKENLAENWGQRNRESVKKWSILAR